MYFLNPGAFWAFSLILIPILIHLFNLRRVKKIYFSNLSFLKDVSRQRKSKSTLKKLLVLFARILAIVFIALAFSRPIIISDHSEATIFNPVIYLDNSLSLQQTDQSGNLLLINGITSVKGFLDALTKDQEVGMVTNDQTVLKWISVKEATEKIQEIDYSQKSVMISDVYEKLKRLQGDDLYIFSDFQQNTSGNLENVLQDTSIRIFLNKLESQISKNLYVDSVYLDEPLSISSGNRLNIALKNTDNEPALEVLVKVFKDELQLASFTVNIGAKSIEKLSLELGNNTDVTGNYMVEIEDSPVVFDNIFFFAINPTKRPLVVIFSESKVDPYLESVFSNEAYFHLVKGDLGNASFQSIVNADLLVLDHLSTIPDWLISQIGQVKGKILICPNKEIDADGYKSLLGFSIEPSSTSEPSILSFSSLENPFFENFFERKDERMNLPSVVIDYNISGYYEPLLTTNMDQPFLVKHEKKYFFTGSLKDQANNFSRHALFVPVMYKLAQRSDLDQLYWRTEEQMITLDLDSISDPNLLALQNSKSSYLPASRISNNGLILELPDVLKDPGIYYLIAGSDTLRNIAINYSKMESEIDTYSLEYLQKLVSGYDHVHLQEISNVQEYIKDNDKDRYQDNLWKYALFLTLFFMISELILLRFI